MADRWIYLQHSRLRAGHTRLSLAKAVGRSVSHISRIEAGLQRPGPPLYRLLADELKVDIDELIASAPVIVTPPRRAVA